jgi:hypothetical protein
MPKKQYDYQHTIQEYVDFVTKKKELQNHEIGDTQTTQRKKTKTEIVEYIVGYIAIIITLLFVIIPMLLVAAAVIAAGFKFSK